MSRSATAALGSGAGAQAQSLFSQTMMLVAATVGAFGLGAYLGRNLSEGWGLVSYAAAFVCLISMRFAVRQAASSAGLLLLTFGGLMGLATAPTIAYYAGADPRAVWDAGAATALFMVGLGAAGYGTRQDLSGLARVSTWALIGLILFGMVMVFADIPSGVIVYSVVGLVIFAGLTVVDFQRLRGSGESSSAPLIAASIFLDGLNVFLLFLNIFERGN